MSSQHSIEAVMGRLVPILDDLDAVPRHAHAVYRSYAVEHLIELSSRSQASCIYDHMVAEADRRISGRSDIRVIEIRGLKLWLLGDHTVFRWKKMDEDGSSRNYPTQQAQDFDAMRPLEGLPPEPTRISVGYLLNPTTTEVRRVQVSRPNMRRIDWCAAIIPPSQRVSTGQTWEEITQQLAI